MVSSDETNRALTAAASAHSSGTGGMNTDITGTCAVSVRAGVSVSGENSESGCFFSAKPVPFHNHSGSEIREPSRAAPR